MLRTNNTPHFLLGHPYGLNRKKWGVLFVLTVLSLGSFGCSHSSSSKFNFKKSTKIVANSFSKMRRWVSGVGLVSYNRVCIYNKVAFDVGSGTTKMKVAKINTCKGEVLKVLLEKQIPVSYKENLVKVKGGVKFNIFIQKKGFKSFKKLLKQAQVFKPRKFVGVGTSSFRKAKNAKIFLKKIKNELKINIKILTQKKEAKLGFVSAQSLLKKLRKTFKNKKLVVWDIGGGSMQMLFKEKRKASNLFLGKYLIYKGNLASISFKNHIIKKIQKKPNKKTPNPLGSLTSKKAQNYSFNYAKKTISKKLQKVFKNKPLVLGIGGVHYHSVFKQVGRIFKSKKRKYYTQYQLKKTLKKRQYLSNREIGGKYASTDISNLALILGFMKFLNINKIYTGKVDLTSGALLSL